MNFNNFPNIFLFVLLVLFPPLGIYIFIKKYKNYSIFSKILTSVFFCLLSVGFYIFIFNFEK